MGVAWVNRARKYEFEIEKDNGLCRSVVKLKVIVLDGPGWANSECCTRVVQHFMSSHVQ